MSTIVTPGRHPAFHPIGRLRKSPFKGGKKSMFAPLNLTAMVDMFTVIVLFLLQNFSASGEVMFLQKGLTLPKAQQAIKLEERGPVITLFNNEVLVEGESLAKLAELDDAEAGIPKLTERLTKIREREEEVNRRLGKEADPTKPYDGHAIIQSDKATDFELVRKAIFAVNMAGWTHLQFAVLGEAAAKEEGAEGEAKPEGT